MKPSPEATLLLQKYTNVQIAEKVVQLQKQVEGLRELVLGCPECERTLKGMFHELTKKEALRGGE